MNAILITSIILVSLAAIFIFQDVAVMELRFLFWTLSMSGALLIFLLLSVGTILGWLIRGSFSRRKNVSVHRAPHLRRYRALEVR